jgi:subfamily B ATP-binding cassette protein MsbA
MPDTDETLSNREKFQALKRVARYRTSFASGLVVLGAFVAFLEGIGLSFI